MKTSDNGLAFISQWEGFSATAYMDANDGWTILSVYEKGILIPSIIQTFDHNG